METHLLDTMLNTYAAQGTPITIVLQNKSRVSGRVRAFDSYVILLQGQRSEIVYRHAVSSIFPTPAVEPRTEQAKQTPRTTQGPAPSADSKKKDRPAPRPAAPAAEPGINTAMKEGLMRWMREQKAK